MNVRLNAAEAGTPFLSSRSDLACLAIVGDFAHAQRYIRECSRSEIIHSFRRLAHGLLQQISERLAQRFRNFRTFAQHSRYFRTLALRFQNFHTLYSRNEKMLFFALAQPRSNSVFARANARAVRKYIHSCSRRCSRTRGSDKFCARARRRLYGTLYLGAQQYGLAVARRRPLCFDRM